MPHEPLSPIEAALFDATQALQTHGARELAAKQAALEAIVARKMAHITLAHAIPHGVAYHVEEDAAALSGMAIVWGERETAPGAGEAAAVGDSAGNAGDAPVG